MNAPDPPATPNPAVVAAAQTASNISTAIASTVLQNANLDTPSATVTFEQDGSFELADPQYDASGNQTGTTIRFIPRWKQVVAYKPNSLTIFNQQQTLATNINSLGLSQVEHLDAALGNPFSLAALPPSASAPAAPALVTTFGDAGAFRSTFGGQSLLRVREEATAAVYERVRWQHDLTRAALINRLAQQGIFPGMEAYDRELRAFGLVVTDAVNAAILAGGQEHERVVRLDQAAAEFEMRAQEQRFRQLMIRHQMSNGTLMQAFQVQHQIADFVNTLRERSLQEKITERSTTLNELSVIMRGGQIQMPAFSAFKGAQVSDTPIGQYIYQSAAMDMQAYKMKSEQQQAMIGGIAGIVGGLATLPMTGGGSLGGNLLGGMMKG